MYKNFEYGARYGVRYGVGQVNVCEEFCTSFDVRRDFNMLLVTGQ